MLCTCDCIYVNALYILLYLIIFHINAPKGVTGNNNDKMFKFIHCLPKMLPSHAKLNEIVKISLDIFYGR